MINNPIYIIIIIMNCNIISCKLVGKKYDRLSSKIISGTINDLGSLLSETDKQLDRCNECTGKRYEKANNINTNTRKKVAKTYVTGFYNKNMWEKF